MLRYRLGLLQYLLGEMEQAESSLQQAVKLEPMSTDYAMALILIYEKQRHWSQAKGLLEQMIQREPNNEAWTQIRERIQQATQSVKP